MVIKIFVNEILIETIKKNVMTNINYKFFTTEQFEIINLSEITKNISSNNKDDSSNGQKSNQQQN